MMSRTVLVLWSTLWAATLLWSGPVSAAAEGGSLGGAERHVSFLGFSDNEAISAWEVEVKQPQPGGFIDHYRIVRIVISESNTSIASFRASPSIRRLKNGRRVAVSQAALLAANPRYQEALPRKQWLSLRRRAKFHVKELLMNDATFRLLKDTDTEVAMKAGKTCIGIISAEGSDVGFQPIVRLLDGKLLPIGHFRIDGREGSTIRACMRAFISPSGFHVAMLADFRRSKAEGGHDYLPQGNVVRLPEVIATLQVGGLNLLYAHMRVSEKLFQSTFPELADAYHSYVGTYW